MPSLLSEDYATHTAYPLEGTVVIGGASEATWCLQSEETPECRYVFWTKPNKFEPLPFDPYFQRRSQLAWAITRQIAISGTTFAFTHDTDARSYAVPLAQAFHNAAKACPAIKIDPDVMAGAPCVAGTRIPVYGVLDAIEHHGTLDGVLQSYPRLNIDQVRDAVLFAKLVVECPLED